MTYNPAVMRAIMVPDTMHSTKSYCYITTENYCYTAVDCQGQKTEPTTNKIACCAIKGMSWGNKMDKLCSPCEEGESDILNMEIWPGCS